MAGQGAHRGEGGRCGGSSGPRPPALLTGSGPRPSEPSCPRTPCWVQNWHSGERPEAWPTEPRSRGRWHRASGLTVPEPGGGCAQLSSSPNFKRQRIIFLSVASKVRWKIKMLKKKRPLPPGRGRGAPLSSRAGHTGRPRKPIPHAGAGTKGTGTVRYTEST